MARAGRKDRGLLSKTDAAGTLRWYVRLYHEGKEQRFGAFKNKTEARAFYEQAKTDQRKGRFFPEQYRHGGKALASAVIASYLLTLPTSGKAAQTIRDEQRYGKWWSARLEGKALHAVPSALIDQAMTNLNTAKKTPQTVRYYAKFLRHVFRWAIGRGLIEKTPFSTVKLPTMRVGRTRFLSTEGEARLCAAIGEPYAAWVQLAILTGLRRSEQFSLRWADIDLERGLMTLPQTKSGPVFRMRSRGISRKFQAPVPSGGIRTMRQRVARPAESVK